MSSFVSAADLTFRLSLSIVTKNGKEVARLIPRNAAVSYLTDSLTGILKGDVDLKQAKEEKLREKYETAD